MLDMQEVTKTYPGSPFTLGPLTLTIGDGETVAVAGKNGAGKTTLFQMMTGNTDVSSGEIYLKGQKLRPDAAAVKRQLGYLPQDLDLPRWVTAREILGYALRLHQLSDPTQRLQAALKYWDCEGFAAKPLATLSHGMQKRVALALATLHDPAFLVLDEPFSGLDLFHIHALEELIKNRTQAGKTTVLSTHDALQPARLCPKLYVVTAGQVSLVPEWEPLGVMERVTLMEQIFFNPES